jgi:transcription elongation factor Elf1
MVMNREQRRAYDRKVRKSQNASICPECKHLANFFTEARGEKDTVLKCERCGAIVREGEELTKMMPPGLYLPTSLEVLDKALLMEAARSVKEDEENDDSGMQSGDAETH